MRSLSLCLRLLFFVVFFGFPITISPLHACASPAAGAVVHVADHEARHLRDSISASAPELSCCLAGQTFRGVFNGDLVNGGLPKIFGLRSLIGPLVFQNPVVRMGGRSTPPSAVGFGVGGSRLDT